MMSLISGSLSPKSEALTSRQRLGLDSHTINAIDAIDRQMLDRHLLKSKSKLQKSTRNKLKNIISSCHLSQTLSMTSQTFHSPTK